MAKHQAISRVCYSFKDAETINFSKMMDDDIFAARQIETLYDVNYRKRMKVRLFTDSEPTLQLLQDITSQYNNGGQLQSE